MWNGSLYAIRAKTSSFAVGPIKTTYIDTLNLCRLLRLGELKEVWRHETNGNPSPVYGQVKEYQRLVKTLTIHKRQLQANLRHWGINLKVLKADFERPRRILEQINLLLLTEEVAVKFRLIQSIEKQKSQQFDRLRRTGQDFWEIQEFQKMSGIGPVGGHTFSGYIQTPHRFRRRGQLISFCQLAVRKPASDGRKVRRWAAEQGRPRTIKEHYACGLEELRRQRECSKRLLRGLPGPLRRFG